MATENTTSQDATMMTDLKDVLTRNPATLALDFAGAAALTVALVGALFLPGLL